MNSLRPAALVLSIGHPWLLCLIIFVSTDTVSTVKLSFESSRQCPTAAASLLAHRLASRLQCAAVCSQQPRCNAFHFDQPNNKCYLGDACSELAQWTAGDCDSYKYTDVLCGDCESIDPVLSGLQMKLFYKFSRSGLVNEVNPRLSCLTAYNVTLDSSGAHFKGSTLSYLKSETTGFEKYLQVGSKYSIFTQVNHVMDTGTQYYSRFQECAGTSPGSSMIKMLNLVYGFSWLAGSAGTGESTFGMSTSFLPTDGTKRLLSFGLTFNQTAHQNFYENGSFVPVASYSKSSSNVSALVFQCLRLGFGYSNAQCLNGDITCFGLSTRLLNVEEFNILKQICHM